MFKIIDPMIKSGVIRLNGKDILIITLQPGTCLKHGYGISIEMHPPTLIREDKACPSCEHSPPFIPDSQTLLFVELHILINDLHVEVPLMISL